jgi:hypothetical protein
MKQLLVLPKAVELTKQERRNLSVNGFLVMQVDDPKAVRLIGSESAEISGTAIMHAAVRAMSQAPNNSKDSVRETFVKLLDQVFSRQASESDRASKP